jgi:glucoamylase
MPNIRGDRAAFGAPGIDPRWTAGNKDAIGTAYDDASQLWFTLWRGIVTEVYYPTIDRPQIRDLQLMITDGKTFVHEEKRHLDTTIEPLDGHTLGYRIRNADPEGRYTIVKEIIVEPHLSCLLQQITIEGDPKVLRSLKFYVLCAPHLDVGGADNSGYVMRSPMNDLLMAERDGTWLALGADIPFCKLSVGFVGFSDGWRDLTDNFAMDWEFDKAEKGNIALFGELDLDDSFSFTLGLSFGSSGQHAMSTLFQSLAIPFSEHRQKYIEQWQRPCSHILPLDHASFDNGRLYRHSYSVLLAHEDKTYPGAMIASLSIPWGEVKDDKDTGGYHLVWTRDLVQSATGLLAAGNTATPLRALIYLATSQLSTGRFPQNFWIDGTPYWSGIQLDEIAFPILLAAHLDRAKALKAFDPYPMIVLAAGFLVREGPVTGQDRWEELSGYSPSTLAAVIAGLVIASTFAVERGDTEIGDYLLDYADFIESHLDDWTVTNTGKLMPEISRHYIRICPVSRDEVHPIEEPDHAPKFHLPNIDPNKQAMFAPNEIVDAGFLELVRYGVRAADDSLIIDSLLVIDHVIKRELPTDINVTAECWYRYNNDGYGQRDDGSAYEDWGVGRLWPLLTGERGHYELALGASTDAQIKTLEALTTETCLLPEQVWDADDFPEEHLFCGKPTGSATPLMWAHAEYIKLLRSAHDGSVFDLVPEVRERYLTKSDHRKIEIWKPTRQINAMRANQLLRFQTEQPFELDISIGSEASQTIQSQAIGLGIHYADLPAMPESGTTISFSFNSEPVADWIGPTFSIQTF